MRAKVAISIIICNLVPPFRRHAVRCWSATSFDAVYRGGAEILTRRRHLGHSGLTAVRATARLSAGGRRHDIAELTGGPEVRAPRRQRAPMARRIVRALTGVPRALNAASMADTETLAGTPSGK